jgi:hypothetical protein
VVIYWYESAARILSTRWLTSLAQRLCREVRRTGVPVRIPGEALRRTAFVLVWSAALLLAMIPQSRKPSAAEFLTIAVAAPLTGSSSHVGPEMVNSVQMLVDRVNESPFDYV